MTVDGTHFRIQEPTPFDKKWFSHKFNGAGLAYEIGIAISTGDIVWFNGPFRAGLPDINIFRSKLKKNLSLGEKVVADRGYKGDSRVIAPDDNKGYDHKRAMRKLRARHETVNSRFKNWGCLDQTYCNDLKKHHLIFKAVVTLLQVDVSTGNISFQLYSYNYNYPLVF